MTQNKITEVWNICWEFFDDYSRAIIMNKAPLCSTCCSHKKIPFNEISLIWYRSVEDKTGIYAAMRYPFGIVLRKDIVDKLFEQFSGIELHPIKQDHYTPKELNYEEKDNDQRFRVWYPYTGPDFMGMNPTVTVWPDLKNTNEYYDAICTECGYLSSKVIDSKGKCRVLDPILKIPKSQLKDVDFFYVKDDMSGVPLFCTTRFKEVLEEFNDGTLSFREAGIVYNDDESPFVPPELRPFQLSWIFPPDIPATPKTRRVKKQKVKFSELDGATLESREDLSAYNILLDTPENEDEATCPISKDERIDYIKMEMSIEKVKRMKFIRCAQLEGTTCWIWKYYDECNAPCYLEVLRMKDGHVDIMTDDTYELSPEQFMAAFHFELF